MVNQLYTHIKTYKAELSLRLRYLVCSWVVTLVVCYLRSAEIIYLILGPSVAVKPGPSPKQLTPARGFFKDYAQDRVTRENIVFSANLKNHEKQFSSAAEIPPSVEWESVPSFNNNLSFIYTNVTEAFYVTLEACICFSVLTVLPLCCYQIWCFLMPSRYHREQRQIFISLVCTLLYIVGCFTLICSWLVPQICQFLHLFSVQTGKLQIINQPRIGPYLSWILTTEVTLFMATLTPLCVYLALKSQWLSPGFVAGNRRYTLYLLLLLAAFLSPPDFSSQLSITLCLFLFFESALWVYLYKTKLNNT